MEILGQIWKDLQQGGFRRCEQFHKDLEKGGGYRISHPPGPNLQANKSWNGEDLEWGIVPIWNCVEVPGCPERTARDSKRTLRNRGGGRESSKTWRHGILAFQK